MIDPFGRAVTYLRVSVTDRCDFRCVYCMAEDMTFLPKRDVLSLEELDRVCSAFIRKGVQKIRITGGEPLVRRNIMHLFKDLSRHLDSGMLKELTLTTNGSQLPKYANELKNLGINRINVSLDTLDPTKFEKITRWGNIEKVLAGLDAAEAAGLKIKINTVVLKGFNDDSLSKMLAWCGQRNFDLTLIETMPMGDIDQDRNDQYVPLSKIRRKLEKDWSLTDIPYNSGGPARYVKVEETGCKLGFITPLTHNFCESCNRVRLTCTGILYMCLGQDDATDLKKPLRSSEADILLENQIDEAIGRKPKGHDFVIDRNNGGPVIKRHMSVTGG
ncbi:MAG: GTP 3',8-cyclase MoaA [Magnetovibrio sp.]|nr:GTP 3',8-cyclase MoaA [Magnetovibrio sp.]